MSRTRALLSYAGLLFFAFILAAVALQLMPPVQIMAAPLDSIKVADKSIIFAKLLCALSVILVVTQFFGNIAKRLGEPAVVGEVLGGIVLGPSLVGYFFPAISTAVFPLDVLPHISVIAQLGIVFYMFVVGLEFDSSALKNNAHSTLFVSHVSIVFPMILGFFLGALTYNKFAPEGVLPLYYSLFMGISLSITAFPVLARILTDKKIEKTKIGKISLACAAIDDVTAWCLLAFCLSLMQQKLGDGIATLILSMLYIALMLFVARPLLAKWIQKKENGEKLSMNTLAFFFVALFVSALATEMIGIHAIFGAFLLGVIIPHSSRIKEELTRYTESLAKLVFLPAFFVFTGLRTQVALLNTIEDWLWCLVIIALATLGKFGGATLAAKYSGHSWRESSAIGILMNTRGLVELVVLNIGLDMGVLSPRLFTLLVIMALATTFMTSPLLKLLLKSNLELGQKPL